MLTRVFQSGNSQAVRIPISFRFQVDTVEILHGDNGDVILRPIQPDTRGEDFLALFEGFDEDFIRAVEERDNTPPQERDTLWFICWIPIW